MISVIGKQERALYRVYHLAKAFFPEQVIKQKQNMTQEPLLHIRYQRGSCFYECKIFTEQELPSQSYDFFAKITENNLPWGVLTGVRPTKLVERLVAEEDMTINEIASVLQDKYRLSQAKSQLLLTVFQKEKALLAAQGYDEESHKEKGYKDFSLYIGIPFCPSICSYCSFSSSPFSQYQNVIPDYLLALYQELAVISQATKELQLATIYIGGGTPTCLSAPQLEQLLSEIDRLFPTAQVKEYTLEAGRADTISQEKLQIIKNFPISRISINPQTMQQETLRRVNRQHQVEDVKMAYEWAREEGFNNINMDIIAGLPGEWWRRYLLKF